MRETEVRKKKHLKYKKRLSHYADGHAAAHCRIRGGLRLGNTMKTGF
jgi:hypothetical protein